MQAKITYGLIDAWNQEIQEWVQTNSVNMLFNQDKIHHFIKTYSEHIVTIKTKMNELTKKYVRFDAENKPLPPTEQEMNDYTKELEEFMNTPISKPIVKLLHDA